MKKRTLPSQPVAPRVIAEAQLAQVTGGSLNAYFERVTGEKQGKFNGG